MTTNIFEQATRRKLRFNGRGVLSVEQLWETPIKTLDAMYQELQLQHTNTESLLGDNSMPNDDKLRCAIIKHIVETIIAENEAQQKASERRQKRQEIMALIVQKENEEMSQKSKDELQKMLDEL